MARSLPSIRLLRNGLVGRGESQEREGLSGTCCFSHGPRPATVAVVLAKLGGEGYAMENSFEPALAKIAQASQVSHYFFSSIELDRGTAGKTLLALAHVVVYWSQP